MRGISLEKVPDLGGIRFRKVAFTSLMSKEEVLTLMLFIIMKAGINSRAAEFALL